MKPVIYITPEGSVNVIMDCPEKHYYGYYNMRTQSNDFDSDGYEQALAEAKKNSIPFEDQDEILDIMDSIGEKHRKYKPFDGLRKDFIMPFPYDQYKVEIKRGNICINCGEPDCVSLLCYDGVDGHCGYERVAVLSPLKPEEDLDEMFKEWIGEKPQEDKLISEPKDMKETALTTEEIEGLKTVGIVSANWYAVCVDKNTAPFALFDCLEYAEAYRKQFLATAIIEPWPMIVKDYRKPRNPQANEK